MNAIIALCHFCEVHGPGALFCTQTLRDTKVNELKATDQNINNDCAACYSIGNKLGLLSKDDESATNFFSTQTPVIEYVESLVKQAAVRSLSCETSFNKNGGFVFFGDASRGHILSHTFQLRDSQARGFYRLFSIIVLMKDKLFLLNVQPFLSEHLENVSKELQEYSFSIYREEQRKSPERAKRLDAGYSLNRAPRSLQELTGEVHIFAILHSHFAWLLWSGARYLTETVTLGSPSVPPWVEKETEDGFAMVQVDKEDWLMRKVGLQLNDEFENIYTLRYYKETIGSDFIPLCYCTLVGIQIVLRGPQNLTFRIIKFLKQLIPEQLHTLVRINSKKYLLSSECRILSVPPEIAVPIPSHNIFRMDIVGDTSSIKWNGDLPNKTPDILSKILRSAEEPLISDFVLEKRLKCLVEEWKNKTLCIKKVQGKDEVNKLKKILGVQPHDQQLINYWTQFL